MSKDNLPYKYQINIIHNTWKATSLFQCSSASCPSTSWPPDWGHWSTAPLWPGRPGSRPRRWGSSSLLSSARGTLPGGTWRLDVQKIIELLNHDSAPSKPVVWKVGHCRWTQGHLSPGISTAKRSYSYVGLVIFNLEKYKITLGFINNCTLVFRE